MFDGTELAAAITTQGLLLTAGVTLTVAFAIFAIGRRAVSRAAGR